jgi:hypothetical protein
MVKIWHGMVIQKEFEGRMFNGTVSYMGLHQMPFCFEVSYEDNDVETMNLKEVVDLAKRGAARANKRRVQQLNP